MIRLDNGHHVLAEFINFEFNVDGKRKGAGIVIAFDREIGVWDEGVRQEGVGEKLYVTWTVYPTIDNHDLWIAETGNYGQNWESAIKDMVERFNRYGFNREFANVRSS